MKRIALGALAVCLLATPAWAGSYSIPLAMAVTDDPFVLTGGTRVVETSFGQPYSGVRCPASGCQFTVNTTYPLDATSNGGFNPITNLMSPPTVTSPAGNVCFKVCFAVVKNGQGWSDIAITTACSLMASFAETLAGHSTHIDFGSFVNPMDTQGVPCTAATCRGQPMLINYQRLSAGDGCTGAGTDAIDFASTALQFQ